METLQKKRAKYRWPNKLSFTDRTLVAQLYLQGYGLYPIGVAFGVTPSTIEYHLKNANLFVPNTKPTMYARRNPIVLPKHQILQRRSLSVSYKQDSLSHYYDEFGERYNRPKSYAQLLKQSQRIQDKKKIAPVKEQPKQQGFLIHVSLKSNVTIQRNGNGYDIYRCTDESKVLTSDSVYST